MVQKISDSSNKKKKNYWVPQLIQEKF